MAAHSDGHQPTAPAATDADDPDSPGLSSFFSRLFRRDAVDPEADAPSLAAVELAARIRNLRQLRVDDVSIPRSEIVAVSDEATLADLVRVFQESTLSRLPVYRETVDQPVGLVHLKDLALRYGFGASAEPFDLASMLRPLLYVPPSMPLGVLMRKMQGARIHMAMVIDEYGGVDGLVTIEDVIEQVVGDIDDEHDDEEAPLWTSEAPGVFVVEAQIELDDFERVAGVRLARPDHDEDVDTLGGLVFRLSGRVPVAGEVIAHPDGHQFEVLDADARRVKRLRVRLKQSGQLPAAESA